MPSKKTVKPAIQTREEMEACIGNIATASIERDRLTVEMDNRIKQIREGYETALGALGTALDIYMDRAEAWATDHPAEFGDKRSIEMVHGIVGFRLGQPQVKPVRGVTWAEVTEALPDEFVRVKREANRDALLAKRDDLGPIGLAKYALKLVQDETFFVEPKREALEPRKLSA